MNAESVHEGGCLCGSIRYRASTAPVRGVICHCSMCRKHTGSLIGSFVHFPVDSFEWTRGEPTRYRSSDFAGRGFCPVCGSTITMHEDVLTDRVQIAVGSLDEPDRVRVDDHVWAANRVAWFDVADELPRFPGISTAVPSKAGESE